MANLEINFFLHGFGGVSDTVSLAARSTYLTIFGFLDSFPFLGVFPFLMTSITPLTIFYHMVCLMVEANLP